ncbi:MAG: ATP-binding cassette domain-containing protein [Beutenbergiaceae bacterium]
MTSMTGTDSILQIRDGWKRFGHVTALRAVSLAARPGEVLALLGDNGAGKSTMVKVLAGVHHLDAGSYHIDGQVMTHASVAETRRHGVSAVFQDLAVVETLDIAANMFLGQPVTRTGIFVDRRAMIDKAAATLQQLKVRIPSVRVPVGELSGGQRQGVAIARAVLQDNPVVLMDEPTAALGVRETRQVGETIAHLRSLGKAVILVSHDMEFVFDFADRIQILRLGEVRALRTVSQTDRREVVSLITGAAPADPPDALTSAMFGTSQEAP